MKTTDQISEYIKSLPAAKQADILTLHQLIIKLMKGCKLWFLDGLDIKGKVVSNPNIGYGQYTITYSDGKTKEFYRIGLSANTTGISVYIMGIDDRKYLPATYGSRIGKANVTGYCIKFKKLIDIEVEVLKEAINYGASLK